MADEHLTMCQHPEAEVIDLDLEVGKKTPGKDKKNEYKFTEDMSNLLVEARISMDSFFKKKSTDNSELWLKVLQKVGIDEKCSIATARKRWDNCRTRWRTWKSPGTGVDNEGNRRAKSKQPLYVQLIDDWMETSHCSNPAKMVDTESEKIPVFGRKTSTSVLSQQSTSSSSLCLDDADESTYEIAESESSSISSSKNKSDHVAGYSQSQRPKKKARRSNKPDALIEIALKHDERNESFQEKIFQELSEMRSLMKYFIEKSRVNTQHASPLYDPEEIPIINDYANIDHTLNLR